jgi:hypothetical protein
MDVQHDHIVFTGVLGDVPRVSNQRIRGQRDVMNVQHDHISFTGVLGDVPRVSNQLTRRQKDTMNVQQSILFYRRPWE